MTCANKEQTKSFQCAGVLVHVNRIYCCFIGIFLGCKTDRYYVNMSVFISRYNRLYNVIMYSEDLFMDMNWNGLSSAHAVVKITLYSFGKIFCTNKCTITPLENI